MHSNAQFYYGLQQEFGKNRVQYKSFFWNQYNYEKYDVFFYLNGKNYAQFASRVIDQYLIKAEKDFEFELEKKIEFVVYNKLSDFKQSNIGLNTNTDNNIGGTTNVIGSKIFLYFNGNYNDFEKQIIKGIANYIVNQLVLGGNFREMARSSAFINLPNWYLPGLSSYYANKWDYKIDNEIRDAMLTNSYKDLSRIDNDKAEIIGHSIWNYIVETYGFGVVTNILYMARATRNIESGFEYVLGGTLNNILNDWKKFYYNKYDIFDSKLDTIPISNTIKTRNKKSIITQIKLSNDDKFLAYNTNKNGQIKIYLYDLVTKKNKLLYKYGDKLNRINDFSNPALAWYSNSEYLSFIIEQKGGIWLHKYEVAKKTIEKRQLFNFEKIMSFNYSHDSKKIVMAAVQNGMPDIFVYNLVSNVVEKVTNDFIDDSDPVFINKSTEIVFSSKRTNDTIGINNNMYPINEYSNLYLFNYTSKSNTLKKITNNKRSNVFAPIVYDKNNLLFLSDNFGTTQQYIGKFDSAIDYIDTAIHYKYTLKYNPISNYNKNTLLHDASESKEANVYLKNNKYILVVKDKLPINNVINTTIFPSPYFLSKNKLKPSINYNNYSEKPFLPRITINSKDKNYIDTDDYIFEFEKKESKNKEEKSINKKAEINSNNKLNNDTSKTGNTFIFPKQLNYNKYFTLDFVVSQVDNTLLSSNYQAFSPGQPFFNPGFTSFVKFGTSDLFGNDRFTAGYRLGFNLRSNEFFASYELLEKKLDKTFLYHRRFLENQNAQTRYRQSVRTNEFKYNFNHPFSETKSLRNTLSIRNDQISTFAVDDITLKTKNIYNTWFIAKTEYIIDNSQSLGLNLPVGTKFKAFAEYYNQVNKIKNNLFIVGVDFRKYVPLFRELILANRIAASSSLLGSQKLIYYLGGVDNWMFAKYDKDTRIDNTQNYVFQTIATNMRGFTQNVRNGNNFVTINEELRFPIFRALSKKPVSNEFLKNFQIIGFYDAGIAWSGLNPSSDQNVLFTKTISLNQGQHVFVLKNYENPIVMGYGLGVRVKLLGYFLRFDWAKGLKDGVPLEKRQFYFSLGLDF